jgi:small subunit ribosomal protein S16
MLKMRLQRVGRKHEPSYRLVLTDSKNSTKSGRFHEILGSYDPRKTTEAFNIDRIKHWLSQGVGVTGTVHNLFVTHKLIDAKKVNVLPLKTPIAKAVTEETPKAEAPVAEAAVAETPIVEDVPVEAPKEDAVAPTE